MNDDSNSIETIVKPLHWNMLSRWTNFLTTGGEKEWRKRDVEFENDISIREQMQLFPLSYWEKIMTCSTRSIVLKK